MSTQDAYTPEEWAAVSGAAVIAGSYIAISDPGVTSLISETGAMMKAITSGDVPDGAGDLVAAIVATMKEKADNREKMEMPDMTDETKKNPAAMKASLLAQIKAGTDAVADKGGATEAEAFKQWILSVATATAEAAKEGGFMGIGGTRVSEQEVAALAEISNAIGA